MLYLIPHKSSQKITRQCISKQPVSVHNKILLERLLGSERVGSDLRSVGECVCGIQDTPESVSKLQK